MVRAALKPERRFLTGFALPSLATSKVGCKPEILTEAYSDFRTLEQPGTLGATPKRGFSGEILENKSFGSVGFKFPEGRRCGPGAGAGADDEFGGEGFDLRTLAAQELLHGGHRGGTKAVLGLTQGG